MVFAEAGVPVTFVTMPTLGTTAPATKAGAFALGAAELVAATVVLQLAAPGAPVAHSIMQSYADPRSGGFVSFPLDGRARTLATELAHHWGVPSEAACCGTDAKRSGHLAGRRRGRHGPRPGRLGGQRPGAQHRAARRLHGLLRPRS